MFRSMNFDRNLDNATSHLHLEPDWPTILLICDAIRQNDVNPKTALGAIKKKMQSPNPHTALYALIVLESVVKNCGSPIHDEICTKENCEMFTNFIESTPHDNVKAKLLELFQTWAFAFGSNDKYQAMKDTVTILKTKGHKFPKLKEADAMFTSETAPGWSDGKVCHRCRVGFSITQRKHHCRNCGQIFCAQCSSKTRTLPKFGIEREVRVCDGCYQALHAPLATGGSRMNETDLPVEYLTSSLAQQSQTPPRKTDQELKEEEELQLAIALSQSEVEQQKSKPASTYRSYQKSPTPEVSSSGLPLDDTPADPELAKYLNREYWEQRKTAESPASPSAPSPMSQTSSIIPLKTGPDDFEIDEFSNNLKTQVEIFVNRMKSNSSRGRSISTDSSVQTLFMNLTASHSQLLAYIKEMDDKRMWFEQLQDKLNQVKDSRAALDVLRQEHQEKIRRQAEEQERQRQLQMAYKLEVMRKKKQEYLQYQRQLALQRIQEQEREMQMRQEQQKAYHLSGQNYSFMPPVSQQQQGSPIHQMVGPYGSFNYNNQMPPGAIAQRFGPQGNVSMGQQPQMPAPGAFNPANMSMPQNQGMINLPQHTSPISQQMGQMPNSNMQQPPRSMPVQQGQFMGGGPLPTTGGQMNASKPSNESGMGTISPPGSVASASIPVGNALPNPMMLGQMPSHGPIAGHMPSGPGGLPPNQGPVIPSGAPGQPGQNMQQPNIMPMQQQMPSTNLNTASTAGVPLSSMSQVPIGQQMPPSNVQTMTIPPPQQQQQPQPAPISASVPAPIQASAPAPTPTPAQAPAPAPHEQIMECKKEVTTAELISFD